MAGIFVQDEFDHQAGDLHHGNLTADLDLAIHYFHIFTRHELVALHPTLRILHVILKTFLRIFRGGNVDFVSIH